MKLPWYLPLLLLLLALVGLGVLGILWLLAVLGLGIGLFWVAWERLRRRLFGPRWRRLPPP
ncbi:hypothetical protein [Thermus neutrinimicus]|uniref:hypothetical protein n=1 Tax=Thermus neutrinimicus TaxID=2908149 RepID=UPI001FAA580F|nr:hypothetical protein [Thermus neutrinimicus]